MGPLAELFVSIAGDSAPLDRTLSGVRHSLVGMTGFASHQVKGMLGPALGDLRGIATHALVGGVAVGGAAAAAGLWKSITAAGDLNETLSKTEAVFGDQVGVVKEAADQMAAAYGTPKRAFLDAASAFGLIASGAGVAKEASAGMSVELAKLAEDASSFYNTPLDVALEKIRAGLTGESEPLRAFGVLLSEAAVQEEALAMGLAKSKKEIDDQAKVMARASLIKKGLGVASGDRERTKDSASNRQREIMGRAENASASIGAALLPAWNNVLAGILKVEQAAGGFLEEHKAQIESMADTVGGYLGHLVELWTEMAEAMGEFAHSESGQLIVQTIGGILQWLADLFDAVIGGISFGMRHWDQITQVVALEIGAALENVGIVMEWLMSTAGELLDWFGRNWSQVFVDAFNATLTGLFQLQGNFVKFGAAVGEWFRNGMTGDIKFIGTPILDGFKATMEELPKIAKPALRNVSDEVAEAYGKMIDEDVRRRTGLPAAPKAAEAADAGGAAAAAAAGQAESKAKTGKAMDQVEFARKLQEGALNKDALAKEQLAETKRQTAFLKELSVRVRKGGFDDPVATYE